MSEYIRKGDKLMICPIMSANKVQSDLRDFIPCINSCALYVNGHCSIAVLAKKAIHDSKKSTDSAKHCGVE